MTPTATWHVCPEFGLENPFHLTVCGSNLTVESDEFLGSVAPSM